MPHRPNVLVFVSHDSGRCVSPLGYNTFDTPNCQRLAAEGVTLTRAFCTPPPCSPTWAALLAENASGRQAGAPAKDSAPREPLGNE